MSKRLAYTLSLLLLLLVSITVAKLVEVRTTPIPEQRILGKAIFKAQESISPIIVGDTIRIAGYFNFIDSLVTAYDSLTNYPLSEHLLVNANSWIVDTLAQTDYYKMIQRDSFVYDQRQMIVLRPNNTLLIPDSLEAQSILGSFKKTRIDINLPEYKLRIFTDSVLMYSFPIRIGQNKKKYLKMGDRMTDLRTQTGKGSVIGFRRNPDFYNPVTGKQFYYTHRDDKNMTLMPQIPWIETEINGIRNGQLIHPTTNPNTLEKAYSNGCIGVKEGDAWRIYYHCPIGTPLDIRYDLHIPITHDSILILEDVYNKAS